MPRMMRVLAVRGDRAQLPLPGDDDHSDSDLLRILDSVDSEVRVLAESGSLELYRRSPGRPAAIEPVDFIRGETRIDFEDHSDRTFKMNVDPLVVSAVLRDLTGVRGEVASAKSLELPSDYESADALLRAAALVALVATHKAPKSFIARIPSAFVLVTVTSKRGASLAHLELRCDPAEHPWVVGALGLSLDTKLPWDQLVACPEKPAAFLPPPKHDPQKPYTTGSASARIEALYGLSRRPEAKQQFLDLLADPANAGLAFAAVRAALIDQLIRLGGDDVSDVLFGRLRSEDSDEIASKIAARAAKFPDLLGQWCRELVDAWSEDRRYAHRILQAISEDYARVQRPWLGKMPPELERGLPPLLKNRLLTSRP